MDQRLRDHYIQNKMMFPVSSLADIPREPHYVIIDIGSIHIPGDERSRTHPGHGYPAHDHKYVNMHVTTDKEAWVKEISKRMETDPRAEKFIAYHVESIATMQHQVQVQI